MSPPIKTAGPPKAAKQPQLVDSNMPERHLPEERVMFRISNNPDLTLKYQNQQQLGSGPSFPSNDSGELPNITSVIS